MRRRAVGVWGGLLMLGASAVLGTVLLVSGPAMAATCPPYGPCTTPTTVTPTTVGASTPVLSPTSATPPSPTPSPTAPAPSSPLAFTGAELALIFTIGAVALGVGGMLVLVTRRRRSEPAYERGRR